MRIEDAAATPEEELIYAISHNLRAPLLNFQGFLRRVSVACQALGLYLQDQGVPDQQRPLCRQLLEQKVWPSLEILERNAQRMDRLLGALLELSRAGREPVNRQLVDTAEVAREVAEEFQEAAAARKAVLALQPLPALWADPDRLRRVFRLLLSNALQFLSPHRPGQITLGGQADGEERICWVRDNGIGIKPTNQARIFLPFGRIQEIEAPGEGIGLAIARKLMKQQEGRIWVDSTHGEGSTFYLAFPPALPQTG